jgi:hypothetical protein
MPTTDKLDIRTIGVIDLNGAEENMIATAASRAADALQESWEKGIAIRAIRGSMPDQGDGAGLATGQTTRSRVGIVV